MLLPRVVHLPINSLNNHHYVKNVFLRSSVTIAGFVTKNERGEVAKESLINSSILTRYFPSATEVTHELSANQLSRAVIDGMIKDAVSSNDTVTLDVIIRSGVEIENIDKLVLESAADCYLRNKKYRNAFQLFHMCNPYSGAFSNKLCMKLLQDLINHYQWESAFRATVYMILHQYRIPPESVFFTISGLIEKPNGTVKVLELIKLIVSSRRMDLADHFNLSKVCYMLLNFSRKLSLLVF